VTLDSRAPLVRGLHPLGLEVLLPEEPGLSSSPGRLEVVTVPGEERRLLIRLANSEPAPEEAGTGIIVSRVSTPSWQDVVKVEDENGITKENPEVKIRIRHGRKYKITVTCGSRDVGEHKIPIVVAFYNETRSLPVAGEPGDRAVTLLAVEVTVRVETPLLRSLLPVEPYTPRRRPAVWQVEETVPGCAPLRDFSEDFLVTTLPLGDYPVSGPRARAIASGLLGSGGETAEEQRALEDASRLLQAGLDEKNYAVRFELLLHCEQLQQEQEARQQDLEGAELRLERSTGLVVVEVAALQGDRLNPGRGDRLYLRRVGDTRVEYEAFVYKVEGLEVWLGADERLLARLHPGARWDLRFALNLRPAKLMHRAVCLARSLGLASRSLFPRPGGLGTYLGPRNLVFHDQQVAANPEQRAAVEVIVSRLSGPAPVRSLPDPPAPVRGVRASRHREDGHAGGGGEAGAGPAPGGARAGDGTQAGSSLPTSLPAWVAFASTASTKLETLKVPAVVLLMHVATGMNVPT
jgi:hypothetical protein